MVAVRITNKTNSEITVKDDLIFTTDGQQVFPMEPLVMKQSLKQLAATHLLYLLLSPLAINTMDNNGNIQSSFPVGLFLGPGIAIGNLAGASSANNRLTTEYSEENILNKKIGPGETITGLMVIKTFNFPSLDVIKLYKNPDYMGTQ